MYLVDCFIPAITYVIETFEGLTPERDLDYSSFRQTVMHLLRDYESRKNEGAYSDEDFQNGLFAVAAFIDEQVMNSSWSQKSLWGAELLQRHFFNTTRGGVEFFSRLDALNPFNPVDRDIREVYFYCLALGFSGQYYRPGDKAHLAEMIASNADVLCAGIKTERLLENAGDSNEYAPIPKPQAPFPRTPFYVGVPILLLIGLFMFYRHGILAVVNNLLLAI